MANARELVLKGLYQIEEKGAYSNKALRDILDNSGLAPADRAFVTELLMGVVRNKLKLDHMIAQFSKVRLKKAESLGASDPADGGIPNGLYGAYTGQRGLQ